MSVILFTGGFSVPACTTCHMTRGVSVQGEGVSVQGGGSLSRVGVSVLGGGSLSREGLCPRRVSLQEGLYPREVSTQGVSVKGGLCPGVGLC